MMKTLETNRRFSPQGQMLALLGVLLGPLLLARAVSGAVSGKPGSAPARPDLRPLWSRGAKSAADIARQPNISILAVPQYQGPVVVNPITEWLSTDDAGHDRRESSIRAEWLDLTDDLTTREHHQLDSQQEQLTLAQRGKSLGRAFLRSLLVTRVRESLKKVEKRSDPVRMVSQAQQTIDRMAGQGMNMNVGSRFRLGSRADLLQQRGQVWMQSPFFNGSFDFQLGPLDLPPDQLALVDRYRVSVNRELPLQFSTAWSYGATTQTMTTTLSRPLLPHLSCTLENRQYLLDSTAEQMARLNYQLVF